MSSRAKINVTTLAAMIGAALSAPAGAEEVEDLASMVSKGKASVNVRYRYEWVDQDGIANDAKASTARSRLTLNSAVYKGFSFLAEFDDVSYVGDDDFNSTTNGKTQYPVVADPEGTEVNQAWVKYAFSDASGTYGRQRILHGSQRFVGGVAWRQNEQTYDGFRALWQGPAGLKLDYAYVYNVNRIFGPDDGAQPANWHGANNLARLDWKIAENHSLAAYYYGLDIDLIEGYSPNVSANNSSDTFGVEYSGKLGPVTAKAAYATQSDAGESQLTYDADYYFLEGGMKIAGVTGVVGYEVLGAGDGVGFKTPLATLHKFQGWADKFLVTPGDGVEDLYVGVNGALGPVKLGAFYHDFKASDSSADFGSEIDLVATWPVNKLLNLQLKYAEFSTDDSSRYTDTSKVWMTVMLKL